MELTYPVPRGQLNSFGLPRTGWLLLHQVELEELRPELPGDEEPLS